MIRREPPVEIKKVQSKRDPNTSYAGIVEKRFVVVVVVAVVVVVVEDIEDGESTGSTEIIDGGGGNDARI